MLHPSHLSANTMNSRCWDAVYPGPMDLDTLLAVVCKAANPGAPLVFLGAHWLFTWRWLAEHSRPSREHGILGDCIHGILLSSCVVRSIFLPCEIACLCVLLLNLCASVVFGPKMPPKKCHTPKTSGKESKRKKTVMKLEEKVKVLDMLKEGKSFAVVTAILMLLRAQWDI